MSRVAAALLLALLPACTYVSRDDRVLVTSTPAGAEILVDGEPSGRTTPSLVEFGGFVGSDRVLTIRKDGYGPESRLVRHRTDAYTSRWIDGAVDGGLWSFPLWWTFGDWFTPFALRHRYVPHELHVRLHREGTGPVSIAPGTIEPVEGR